MHLRIYQVTALLIVVVIIMFAMGLYVAEMMNNVRAYVRGENLWAKAQNGAVTEIYKYAYTQEHMHMANARAYLRVNLGDKKARLALQQTPADRDAATQGFLQGDNHPDDIPGMISLFIYYQDVYLFRRAIQIWTDADQLIDELQKLMEDMEVAVLNKQKRRIEILTIRLDTLDLRLREKEMEFSAALGESARWIKTTLVISNTVLFILLIIIASIITRNIGRQLQTTEQKLRISDNRFMSLFRSDLVGIAEFHFDGRILEANSKFLSITGVDYSQIQARELNWLTLSTAQYSELDRDAIRELRIKGACAPYDKKILHTDGHTVPVYIGAVRLHDDHDTCLAFMIDKSDQYAMEQKLRLSAIVMEHSQDGIVILDKQEKVMSVNKAFCEMAKCDARKITGELFNLAHRRMDEEEKFSIRQAMQLKENWEGDINFQTNDLKLIPVRLSISIVQDDKHEQGQYVLMFSDIKSRKAAEERLHYLANFDSLTGIENRATFQAKLNKAIARAQRTHNECAIFFIDLNKFKPVNDHHGHEVGDKLLIQVAGRLKDLMRNIDTVARIGGDEFVVIAEDITDLRIVRDMANRMMYAVAQPYTINGIEINISCSVGISIYPRDGLNDIELIRAADIAMYAAKSKGESQYYFFNPDIKY